MEELSAGRPLLGLHWSCSLHVVGAIVYCVGLEVKIPRPVPRQLYCSCCTLLLRAAGHASLRGTTRGRQFDGGDQGENKDVGMVNVGGGLVYLGRCLCM